MEQGEAESKIIEMAQRQRMPLPEAIENAPQLELGLEFYWDAFFDLNSCRWRDMGPIPHAEIRRYARDFQLDEDEAEELTFLVEAMDKTFLDKSREEHAKKTKNK